MASDWLQVRTGPCGLVLLENQTAYEILPNAHRHQLILVVGGKEKTKFLDTACLRKTKHADGIRLHVFSPSLTVADCALHDMKKLDALHAVPSARGSVAQHDLQTDLVPGDSHHRIARFAYDMYWRLLAPFVSVILLFMSDLGGPLGDMLVIKLSALLRTAEPYRARTQADVEKLFRAFGGIGLIVPTPATVTKHVTEVCRLQQRARLAFHDRHLAWLLRNGVAHYVRGPYGPVDVQRLARRHRPPPTNLADHMAEFVKVSYVVKIDHVEVIASALDLDAHPPVFTPASTFDTFYAAALLRVGADFQAPTIREAFVRIAVERRSRSSAEAHLRLLSKYQVAWMGCYSTHVCLVCLVHEPRRAPLPCGHQLCETCVVLGGEPSLSDLWQFQIAKCPLCRMHCDTWVTLQPPTAGSRVLWLGGLLEQKMAVAQFLKELQALVGLAMSLLRDRFDVIVGSDIGAFFVQMMVTEQWDLADCVYHLPRLTALRLRAGNTVVSYGKNLDWELRRVEQFNGTRVVIDIQGRVVTNGATTMSADPALAQATARRSPDVVVECCGEPYDAEYLRTAAVKMTASLFFIELRCIPTFSSGQAVARVELQCRLRTGPPLFTLLARLRQ
ncbi:hypothetical protein SPBR_05706 [Sporothrix brasiliensis 5110]|uniref:RING-type domain-containing protein n=1 Tax=Sporothrix brasiliensis 5110 TaxID=1398154 RepID=A0A0C2IYR5_9PEZI|nr:uncharacterized protein SPBR_05706 [Sporothrix brasiliensis 5110]KIH94241.1 hypothetical protein SPBR_05706 [Sporothrix brasiliensis 5110]